MWIIAKGSTSYQYPTCAEKQVLTNPSYIIKWVQDTGKNTRYCAVTDSSSYPGRYQKFTITETQTPTWTSGQVKLLVGDWKVWIYEISAADLSNIANPANVDYDTLTCVQSAERVQVTGTVTTLKNYTYSNTMKQYE